MHTMFSPITQADFSWKAAADLALTNFAFPGGEFHHTGWHPQALVRELPGIFQGHEAREADKWNRIV
jgi:hypothetical protein